MFSGEEALELVVDDPCELAEGLHRVVVAGGKAAADVDQVHLVVPAVVRLLVDARAQRERLHVVVEVGGLAPHVEAQPLAREAELLGEEDEVDRLARGGAELG
jgi:hypothetical protein